jgi:glycosyltransferase involved in cell wall biosynthesis
MPIDIKVKMPTDHRRIKLLFFISEDWYFWSHRLPLALSAIERGWDVYLVTRVSAHGSRIEEKGIKLLPLNRFKRGFQNPLKDLLSLLEIVRIYIKVKPDLVQHVALKPIVLGTVAAHLTRVRSIFNTFAGMGSLFTKMDRRKSYLPDLIFHLFRFIFKPRRVRLVFQNASDRDMMVQKNIAKKNRTALVKGSGVDVRVFHPVDQPGGPPIVLMASRMLWDKGVGEFFDAAKQINSKGLKARFVLAGGPDPENPNSIPQAQLEQWRRSGYVEWWGHQDDMAQAYAKSHIFCLPSYREGLPKAILEACASGRPVITTDTIGCRDIVRHGENGLLVPPRDAHALSDAIEALIEDPERRRRMGMKGRAMVEQEYAEEKITRQTFQHYLAVCRS